MNSAKMSAPTTPNVSTKAKTGQTTVRTSQVATVVAAQIAERPVYQFRQEDKVWFTRTPPGRVGPSVYRPMRKGKPTYGWATWAAPLVPSDAVLITHDQVPDIVKKKLGEVERMVRASDAVMVNLIGPH